MKTKITIVASLFLVVTSFIYAGSVNTQMNEEITIGKANACVDGADLNSDGHLDQAEYETFSGGGSEVPSFETIDSNSDGKIVDSEMEAYPGCKS
jgi:Ca2+-binding EF-hand superfamily protein